ncbi:MAG: ATP-binding protein [Saccharospirillum sp.]
MIEPRRTFQALNASLSRRLLLWIGGLFTCLVLVITAIQISLNYRLEERSGARNIAYSLFSTRDVLANALWSFDPSQITASADLLFEHPLITAVIIESEDASLDQIRGEPPAWPEQSRHLELNEFRDVRIDTVHFFTARLLRFRMNVEFVTNNLAYPVGEVTVYSSVARILSASRINLAFTLLSAAMLCIVLVAVTAWSVKHLVARRLQWMQAEMARLAPEDDVFKPRLLPQWLTAEHDEIGSLAETLNRLQVQLAEKSSHAHEYQQTLELQIQQRTQELERALSRLQVSDAHKNAFLANMSHEIRTPMNGIIGMTELLRDTPLNAEQQDYLDTILTSAQALTTIINDILDLSKIEAGKLELEAIPFNLKEVIDTTLALFLKQAEEKSLAVGAEIAPDIPVNVIGDPTRLRQILLNLFSNAFKFTDNGEITIDVHPVNAQGKLRFSVTDTGPGISVSDQANLFNAFSQAKSSTSRQFGGTGLGLAICKRLVELMGGTIGVDSQPGRGSTFWFELALPAWLSDQADTPRGRPEPEASQGIDGVKGQQILLVEDNKVNQKVAEGLLKRLGVTVVTANHGEAALAQLRSSPNTPDLILMDCEMPVMDGYQATRAIRRLPAPLCNVPIIGLSAHAMSEHRQRALEAGMNDYLTKPLRREALADMLRHWLNCEASQASDRPTH